MKSQEETEDTPPNLKIGTRRSYAIDSNTYVHYLVQRQVEAERQMRNKLIEPYRLKTDDFPFWKAMLIMLLIVMFLSLFRYSTSRAMLPLVPSAFQI